MFWLLKVSLKWRMESSIMAPWKEAPVIRSSWGSSQSCTHTRLPWLAVSSRSNATRMTEYTGKHLPWLRARAENHVIQVSKMDWLYPARALLPPPSRCRRGPRCWWRCPSAPPPPAPCPPLSPTSGPGAPPWCWCRTAHLSCGGGQTAEPSIIPFINDFDLFSSIVALRFSKILVCIQSHIWTIPENLSSSQEAQDTKFSPDVCSNVLFQFWSSPLK